MFRFEIPKESLHIHEVIHHTENNIIVFVYRDALDFGAYTISLRLKKQAPEIPDLRIPHDLGWDYLATVKEEKSTTYEFLVTDDYKENLDKILFWFSTLYG